MPVRFSQFAQGVTVEGAFGVLARARQLKAAGKEVIELEIGDSPFPTPPAAKKAGLDAIEAGDTHYCPSAGLPDFRATISRWFNDRFAQRTTAEQAVVGPGAKIFEVLFCEAFLDPGDEVLVFSPYFPTYLPNIERRQARARLVPLAQANAFRPDVQAVAQFLQQSPRPRAIFLNSPHNPTGGVATAEDLAAIASLIRGRDVMVFSDEPYDQMVWQGRHHTLLEQPGMFDQCVAAYTFSKSYSMSGWRLGYAISSAPIAEMLGKLINTSLSCTPPLVQRAGMAALEHDAAERDRTMQLFRRKVEILAAGLAKIDGVHCPQPAGTFYAFPNVAPIANRLGITSHGLAMYLLEGADDALGIACLGGECFGEAGAGFLRFSCAEPDDQLARATEFLPIAWSRTDRVKQYLDAHPEYRLKQPYPEP